MEDHTTPSPEEQINIDASDRRLQFGLQLKAAREAKGLTPQDVEHLTRISLRFIAALEEGDLDALPGKVFGRGFVKNICKSLNLDSAPLLQSYEACWEEENKALKMDARTRKKQDLFSGTKGGKKWQNALKWSFLNYFSYRVLLFWILIPAGLATLASLAFLKLMPSSEQAIEQQAATPVPAVPEKDDLSKSEGLNPSLSSKDLDSLSKDSMDGQEEMGGLDQPAAESKEAVKVTDAAPAQGTIILQVKAPVKIRHLVGVDKYEIKDYNPGTYTFNFTDKMDFYIFDISAIEIQFNGQKIGSLGAKGEERKLTFHAHALEVGGPEERKLSGSYH